jgi:CTP-dependent riboflavin kinase
MSVIVKGTKISGLGLGVTTVAKQYEHLVREFPDIRDVHRWGTLNLQLAYPLRILNPDYTTSAIEWEPGFKEKFSLTRIDIEPCATGQLQPAWIYVAHRSPHRANTLFIEMLTATLEVENGDRFLVHLPDYRYSSCIVL